MEFKKNNQLILVLCGSVSLWIEKKILANRDLKMNPDIVILETGANDGLRGIDPALVEKNISSIIEILHERNIEVLLAGMQMVTNLGPDYLDAFNRIYPRLAEFHQVILMPFFLKDVAAQEAFNLDDGIHPNAQGYSLIAQNILPYVKEAIDAHQKSLEKAN